jgi:hypothetical protein
MELKTRRVQQARCESGKTISWSKNADADSRYVAVVSVLGLRPFAAISRQPTLPA